MGIKVTQDGGGDLSKSEAKAAPEAEHAIELAAQDAAGPTPEGATIVPQETHTQPEDGLSTLSTFKSSVRVGRGERQLDEVVLEAKRESGLTTAKWNELDRNERSKYIQATVDRMNAEAEKASTSKAATDKTEEAKDVRVSMDRGVGGRYVALGGGERVRVAEASTRTDTPIKDDEELQSA